MKSSDLRWMNPGESDYWQTALFCRILRGGGQANQDTRQPMDPLRRLQRLPKRPSGRNVEGLTSARAQRDRDEMRQRPRRPGQRFDRLLGKRLRAEVNQIPRGRLG